VEFNRTTRLPASVHDFNSEDDLVSSAFNDGLIGVKGKAIKIFYKNKKHYAQRHDELTPNYFWDKSPSEKHASAMLAVEQRLDKVKEDVESTQKNLREEFQKFGLIVFVGAVVTILGLVFGVTLPFVYNQFAKSREIEAQHAAEIDELRQRVQRQQNFLDGLPSRAVPAKPSTASKAK
jgi:tetrahydromethanopterin S-methyltransferase subunit G